ncbi:mediator of RNA polymerase II transcription subunit 26-like isoform X2 [Danio rerio]|uniref:Mediator of RNA polymerase II transcription subunit 26-like isoform X2 n=1 Tax=Danio rerio TaxID=7955 RepID=A0AC58GRN5_DANRE
MKRASSIQQLKEQLMQAVDAQNNIQNMVAVLDVICCLESYPMTKETLEETRLGKLINDVRKRSTDKYLVKRLKKLVRRWQTLAGINERKEPNLSSLADQVNSTSAEHTGSAQTRTENNSQSIFQNSISQKAEVSLDSLSGKTMNHTSSLRKSKIPILANRLYCSSIKHSQHFTSFRTSQPIQHCQDDHNVIIRDQHTLQKYSISDNHNTKHVLSAQEPAQSTCITSSRSNLQQSLDLLKILQPAVMTNVNRDMVTSTVTDTSMKTSEDKTRKDQHNNHIDRYDCRPDDCSSKTTLHEAKAAYDPHTRHIQTTASKISPKDCQRSIGGDFHGTEHLEENDCSSKPTNWREMSKLIESSLPTLERSEIDFSRDENFTQKQNIPKECRKTFIPGFHVMDLPGVSREVTKRDLTRVRSQRWHGVNGCFDNRNNWYEWTQSITLDPYGDGNKLQILPYVNITDSKSSRTCFSNSSWPQHS